MSNLAHPRCQTEAGHICQKPSGNQCIENGCTEPAGTWWGPLWCVTHDEERINRISKSLSSLAGGN